MHGALGVGFPLIATPLIALGTDVRYAIVVILIPTLVVNIASIVREGAWLGTISRYWPLALFGVIGSLMGTSLLVVIDPEPFRLLLAGGILAYLGVSHYGACQPWILRHPRWASVVFGLTGGLLAGTVNVMLPALIVFALEMRLSTRTTVQVLNFCFLTGKLAQGAILALNGLLPTVTLINSIPLCVAVLVALMMGIWLRRRMATETYRRVLRGLLLVMALILMGQYIMTLASGR